MLLKKYIMILLSFFLILSISNCRYIEYRGFSKIVNIDTLIDNKYLLIELHDHDKGFDFNVINKSKGELIITRVEFIQYFKNNELIANKTIGFLEKDQISIGFPIKVKRNENVWINFIRKEKIKFKIGDVIKVSYFLKYLIDDIENTQEDSFKLIYHVKGRELISF